MVLWTVSPRGTSEVRHHVVGAGSNTASRSDAARPPGVPASLIGAHELVRDRVREPRNGARSCVRLGGPASRNRRSSSAGMVRPCCGRYEIFGYRIQRYRPSRSFDLVQRRLAVTGDAGIQPGDRPGSLLPPASPVPRGRSSAFRPGSWRRAVGDITPSATSPASGASLGRRPPARSGCPRRPGTSARGRRSGRSRRRRRGARRPAAAG